MADIAMDYLWDYIETGNESQKRAARAALALAKADPDRAWEHWSTFANTWT